MTDILDRTTAVQGISQQRIELYRINLAVQAFADANGGTATRSDVASCSRCSASGTRLNYTSPSGTIAEIYSADNPTCSHVSGYANLRIRCEDTELRRGLRQKIDEYLSDWSPLGREVHAIHAGDQIVSCGVYSVRRPKVVS